MSDVPILTPSECTALAAIEAKMTPGEWKTWSAQYLYPFNTFGIVALRNATPRMLATIAALRRDSKRSWVDVWHGAPATWDDWTHEDIADFFFGEGELTARSRNVELLATIAAHEATIAELQRQLAGCRGVTGFDTLGFSGWGAMKDSDAVSFTVRNLPKPLHAALTKLAAANRRSINAEVVMAIEFHLANSPAATHTTNKRLRAGRAATKRKERK